MNIVFKNLNEEYKKGMSEFLKFHGLIEGNKNIEIEIIKSSDCNLRITKEDNKATFEIDKDYQVF